ncbi:DUF4011 domain-containing protein [Propionibacteriaceae bacterium Y1923]
MTDTVVELTDKERQVRGLDALGRALAPLVEQRMSALHGADWVRLHEADETERRGVAHRFDPTDPRALLRLLRHQRFHGVDAGVRAHLDELIEAGNRAAHTTSISRAEADRALETMLLVAEALDLVEVRDELTELLAAATPGNRGPETPAPPPPPQAPVDEQSSVTSNQAGAADGLATLLVTTGDLLVEVNHLTTINYALVHNSVSPIRSVTLTNTSGRTMESVRLELALDSPLPEHPVGAPLVITVNSLGPREVIDVASSRLEWRLSSAPFLAFTEAVGTTLHLRVTTEGADSAPLGSDSAGVRLLAFDEWFARGIPELVAAFVRPNDPAIATLVDKACDLLDQRTGSPSLQGYQAGPERVHQIAEAIYDALAGVGVRYLEPPPSFETTGQRIRSHSVVLGERMGTCLDLTCLYAAALEYAGLHPVVVVVEGHAFTGFLTDDNQLPLVAVDRASTISTLVGTPLFDAVETTAATAGNTVSYDEARGLVHQWWYPAPDKVRYLVDVHRAHRLVRPLPNVRTEGEVTIVEVLQGPMTAPERRGSSSKPSTEPGGAAEPQAPPRVQAWQRELLDMSYNNPLLRLRRASSLQLHVPAGSLGAFEDEIASGQRFHLMPEDSLADLHQAQGAAHAGEVDPEVLRRVLLEEQVVHVAATTTAHQKQLTSLLRRARLSQEETGANNLYLTLGTLLWDERGKAGRAPLLLVPVKLTAGRGNRTFKLDHDTTRDMQPNYCLVEKLRLMRGVDLPMLVTPFTDDSGVDVDAVLARLRMELLAQGLSEFQVEESAHLSLVQFSTLEMWRDLRQSWPVFMERPVVKHLVDTPGLPFLDGIDPPAYDPAAEATTYLPIPADGSQIEAVRWAAAGKSFILEGPPGTGKSQTITNLVAHLLSAGQRVLFVAEKQAALDVVKRRLDEVGLGTFSLDLHGRTQTVGAVREQLSSAFEAVAQPSPTWEPLRATHRNRVESLSHYPAQLHELGPVDLSAWSARQILLELTESSDVVPLPTPRQVVSGQVPLAELYEVAQTLGDALSALGRSPAAVPWRLAGPVDPATLDRPRVTAALEAMWRAEAAVTDPVLRELVRRAFSPAQFAAAARWVETVHRGGAHSPQEARRLAGDQWLARAQADRAAVERFREDHAAALGPFQPSVLTLDLGGLQHRSMLAEAKWFGKKKARLAIIADLAAHLRPGASLEHRDLAPALQRLVGLQGSVAQVRAQVSQLPGLALHPGWNPLDDRDTADHHAQVGAWVAARDLDRELAEDPELDRVAPQLLQSPPQQPGTALDELGSAWAQLTQALGSTPDDLRFWASGRSREQALAADGPAWKADADQGSFIQLGRWLRVRHSLGRITDWGLVAIDPPVRSGELRGPDVATTVRIGVAAAALGERLESTGLIGFDPQERARMTAAFLGSGSETRSRMVHELPARIIGGRSFDPLQRVGMVADLRQQLGRRRGGMSIRQMMTNFGEVITQVTPCFLMSPSSVARFLPPDSVDFDVVVFDEASQIRVPDAIGAMGRGRSVIIVGDSQQMPPSSMFAASRGSEDDEFSEDDDLPVPADMDSILTEGVESRLPSLLLSWHYRSRDESLIAFSNRTYYQNRLSSFPTPPEAGSGSAVSLRNVGGSWEGGRAGANRVNRAEADAIVAEVGELLAADAGRTIGVVTFNTQQRDLVTDLLEGLAESDPLVAAALQREDEPLFVKNLENVQGDERDVILFSLAFAKNHRGRVPLNWGPLTRSGGEKRLNVAITRAKQQVIVFSSFEPHELDLSGSTSLGLAHLKDYLQAAKSGDETAAVQSRAPMRDRHLEQIAARLRAAGLQVRERVGLSDFAVDLAVRLEDRPWLAVLLDGPAWAARLSVGDRDGLPRTVLTGSMGWAEVFRLWLPAWVRDPDQEVAQIVERASLLTHEAVPDSAAAGGGGSASVFQRPDAGAAGGVGPVLPDEGSADDRGAEGGAAVLRSVADGSGDDAAAGLAATAAVTGAGMVGSGEPGGVAPGQAGGPAPAGAPARAANEYRPAHEEVVGPSSVLDLRSQRARDEVVVQLADVTATEGPILLDRLLKVVSLRFGLARLVATRRQSLAGLVPHARLTEEPNGDVVVWPPEIDPSTYSGYRVPVSGSRDVDQVPYPELASALMGVVQGAHAVQAEDALRETLREFGGPRLTPKVRERLDEVLQCLLQQGRLEDRDGLLRVAETPGSP